MFNLSSYSWMAAPEVLFALLQTSSGQGKLHSFLKNVILQKCVSYRTRWRQNRSLPATDRHLWMCSHTAFEPQPAFFYVCHIHGCVVTNRNRRDLYLLAPAWCPGEHTYGTGDGDLWIATHHLTHRNRLRVLVLGLQPREDNSSSFLLCLPTSRHNPTTSPKPRFVILDAFQKEKWHLMSKQRQQTENHK